MFKLNSKNANLMLLLASIIWGSGFITTQIALNEGITPFQLMFARFFLGSILLNIIFYKRVKKLSKGEIKSGILISIFLFIGFTFQTYGLKLCTASVSAFVTVTYVIMVPFLSWWIYKIKPNVYSIIACFLTVIGVSLISIQDDLKFNIGALITLFAALAFALQIVVTDKYTKEYDPISITVVMTNFACFISLIFVVIFAIFFNDLPVLNIKSVGSILHLGIFSTTIAYLCINIGQKYASAVNVGIICSFESIFAALFSFLFFKEVFTVKMFVGAALLFTAIVVSESKIEFFSIKSTQNP